MARAAAPASGALAMSRHPRASPASSSSPMGQWGRRLLFTILVLRYMKTYGLSHEQRAMVSVVQREWVAKNPRATLKTPVTVEDVFNSRMIACPFRLLRCCLVTGGARPRLPAKLAPRSEQGAGLPARHRRERRNADGQPDGRLHFLARVPRRRPQGLRRGRITHSDVDHLMIYDAHCSPPGAGFAHLPIYGLEDLGFVPRGRGRRLHRRPQHRPRRQTPA
jgi:hypothetical protein